jgi:hypothetical protein
VNYWFAVSEGARIESFNSMLSEENQDRLVSEGGACIMYRHLACGFLENGKLNQHFKNLMERLSKMNGWFVPACTLLDHLLSTRGHHSISRSERSQLAVCGKTPRKAVRNMILCFQEERRVNHARSI